MMTRWQEDALIARIRATKAQQITTPEENDTMTEVYDKFDAAFRHMQAACLILEGQNVGRIALKYGHACTAFVQVWGAPMQTGRAGGGGYDRATAAIEAAARKLQPEQVNAERRLEREAMLRLCTAFGPEARDGIAWASRLEAAGFTVANVLA